jgi:hypothetical protein
MIAALLSSISRIFLKNRFSYFFPWKIDFPQKYLVKIFHENQDENYTETDFMRNKCTKNRQVRRFLLFWTTKWAFVLKNQCDDQVFA